MRALKNAIDFITGKRNVIKENIGENGMYLIDKMPSISSRKARTFFHHSIICCITDAFEYFLNADTQGNVFYKNIDKIVGDAGERFIKWETLYHTLFFTNSIRGSDEVPEFEDALFTIFGLGAVDMDGYYEFKRLLNDDEQGFISKFSGAAIKDIFGVEQIGDEDASFIYNFYYNCYTDFYRTYSKYSYVTEVVSAKTEAPEIAKGIDMRLETGQAGG